MFEFRELLLKGQPLSDDLGGFGVRPPSLLSERGVAAQLMGPEGDVVLKLKGDLDFKALDHAVRLNGSEKLRSAGTTYDPRKLWSVVLVLLFVMVDVHGAAEPFLHQKNGVGAGHAYAYAKSEPVQFTGAFEEIDSYSPLSVEYASGVWDKRVHSDLPKVTDGMTANSGNSRCPAREGAEGQSRAKQESQTPGVCNEQVQSPKGKVCSELGRNVETDTETISGSAGHEVSVPQVLTACNNKFLYSVVDPNRFFRPTDWMPTITQDGKVLRLHLRMNNVCSNRMLQGVIGQPGVSANSWS